MKIKRTIEISVEKTRRFVVRQPEADAAIRCSSCGELMLTAEMAAVLLGVKCRRVYQLVETGRQMQRDPSEIGNLIRCRALTIR
jgi:phage FluMu protein Com